MGLTIRQSVNCSKVRTQIASPGNYVVLASTSRLRPVLYHDISRKTHCIHQCCREVVAKAPVYLAPESSRCCKLQRATGTMRKQMIILGVVCKLPARLRVSAADTSSRPPLWGPHWCPKIGHCCIMPAGKVTGHHSQGPVQDAGCEGQLAFGGRDLTQRSPLGCSHH